MADILTDAERAAIRYRVEDLPAAWAFVMAYVDKVGADPRITISPLWRFEPGAPDDREREFEVVVAGMVEEDS